ncbi:unnamed protein product, partial [marine sediment metagenome]
DWYVELSKTILTGNFSEKDKQSTVNTLVNVLETLLRLLHPCMPFITESLWQTLTGKNEETIMLQPYPESHYDLINESLEKDVEFIKSVILAIRNVRGEMNISPSKKISVLCKKETAFKKLLNQHKLFVMNLAKLESIEYTDIIPQNVYTALAGQLELFIPMSNLIDKDAEAARLNKEIAKLEKDLQHVESKLNNSNFVEKAPTAVLIKETENKKNILDALTKFREKLDRIQ